MRQNKKECVTKTALLAGGGLCYPTLMEMAYDAVIGLEVHAELKTRTKMFCDSLNDPNEVHANINICPICMGHPGTLPVINHEAVTKVLQVGLALHGSISEVSQFDRKNYFYPDLPKGYQISQYQHPLVKGGWLEISSRNQPKHIRIHRIHLEEDTGRSIHDEQTKKTLLDFNRAGVPLMELVTEPDLSSGEEVRRFGEALQQIFRYLDASDANMEKGQMRIEVNISLRRSNNPSGELGTKVEVKNINSLKFAADAVEYEIGRQSELLRRGERISQETRGWDEAKKATVSQRLKEESHDYRYFPEPDLPPLRFDAAFVESLRASLPELPSEKFRRFREEFEIDAKLAETIVNDKYTAHFFENVVSELKEWLASTGKNPSDPQPLTLAANYLTTDLTRLLSAASAPIQESLVDPENFAELITYLYENRISSKAAKEVLAEMFSTGKDPSAILDERSLWQVSDVAGISEIIEKVVLANSRAAEDYRAGKATALQFLVGQVMKEAREANPEVVHKLLEEKLK